MEPLLNSTDFLKLFQFPCLGYENPVVFTDGNYGFSVLKSYPNDYGSLLRVFIRKDALQKLDCPLPVTIEVTYGEKTGTGIRLAANATSDPIELLSIDEFYFDPIKKKFSRKSGVFGTVKEIEPRRIIEIIHKWSEISSLILDPENILFDFVYSGSVVSMYSVQMVIYQQWRRNH